MRLCLVRLQWAHAATMLLAMSLPPSHCASRCSAVHCRRAAAACVAAGSSAGETSHMWTPQYQQRPCWWSNARRRRVWILEGMRTPGWKVPASVIRSRRAPSLRAYRLCCPYWVQRAPPPGSAQHHCVQRGGGRQRVASRQGKVRPAYSSGGLITTAAMASLTEEERGNLRSLATTSATRIGPRGEGIQHLGWCEFVAQEARVFVFGAGGSTSMAHLSTTQRRCRSKRSPLGPR